MIGIIIFTLAAIFLGMRLYAVLGSRTGHEHSMPRPEEPTTLPMPEAKPLPEAREPARATMPSSLADDRAAAGIRAISAADRSFTLPEFVEGAQSAYRLILEAFWSGKLDEVRDFVSQDVFAAFADAARAREEAGEVLDNRLIAIERTVISDAEFAGGLARLTVRFDADIAAVTRNGEGAVIAGSLTDAIATHDVWTFERDIRSTDPNWVLVDTDEA